MSLIGERVEDQARQCLLNIKAIAEAAGYEITHVLNCRVFLTNMSDFAKVNEVYASFFGEHKPARCAVEVSRLPRDVKVEIEAICVKG